MVTNEGRVKVLDFGLAKSAFSSVDGGEELPTEALTAEGHILGTVAYMSPEQAEGKPVDPQSDVFSLGILLYEMTTGQRPFQGDTTLGTLSAVLQAKPKPVAELKPEVSPRLAAIIERCLERQPPARYLDASELHEALLELSDNGSSPTSGERSSRVVRLWLAAAVLVVVAVIASWWFRSAPESRSEGITTEAGIAKVKERPMVAVMPFQNLGSSQDEYFAIGMTEEIASRMASVPSIGVIATSSTRQYAGTQKSAQEIGKELGAGFLVTGSVLWARSEDGSSKIRITPQLVSTVDETQVWAQSYDRVLDDIFAIQTEIASQVVSHLGISLAEPERAAVAQFPTANLAAYDAYLRAMAVPPDLGDPKSVVPRIEKLYRAVELDPRFALAWFQLTVNNSQLYTMGYDRGEERRRLTLEAAQRVEEAAPGSALAAAAMGHYQYRIERDYDRALEDLTRAVELDPNLSVALWMRGSALRRRADFEAAAKSYQAAVALDPRSWFYLTQLGIADQYLRRYEEAVDTFDRAIALAEDALPPHYNKVVALWSWGGHRTGARQALEAFPMQRSPVAGDYLWFWQAVYERDFRAAADRVEMSRVEWLGMPVYSRPPELLEGLAKIWLGELDLGQQQFEMAVSKLQTRLSDAPDNEKVLSSLGVALAALGRSDEAIKAALRATEIVPLATDPWFALAHIEDLAWVYTLLGDYDSASEQLEILLERPSRLTISFLKMDPRWEPLWDQPRFRELERKYDIIEAP
jgi:TolB-like protein/Flp pilus assembly protein TadD